MKVEIFDPTNKVTLGIGELSSPPRVGDYVHVRTAGPSTTKPMQVTHVEWMIDDTVGAPPQPPHGVPVRVFVKV